MSDVNVLYNQDAVRGEELVPLCEELRAIIAPFNELPVEAIVVQLNHAEYSTGFGDIDVSIMCSIEDKPSRADAVEPLSKAVTKYIQTYVAEHGLDKVKTVSAVARVAVGKCTFKKLN